MDKGLNGWLLQRVTSLFLLFYIVPLLFFWLLVPSASFSSWHTFVMYAEMRVLGGLAAISLLVHACIGIWVVATDYVQIAGYQQLVLSIFYAITVLSSMAMLVMLWSP